MYIQKRTYPKVMCTEGQSAKIRKPLFLCKRASVSECILDASGRNGNDFCCTCGSKEDQHGCHASAADYRVNGANASWERRSTTSRIATSPPRRPATFGSRQLHIDTVKPPAKVVCGAAVPRSTSCTRRERGKVLHEDRSIVVQELHYEGMMLTPPAGEDLEATEHTSCC